jgi:hypothetical protein
MRFLNLVYAAVALAPGLGWAQEGHFSSGPKPVALIELFTSEGCSSCPPADRWLGALRTDRGLWRNYVPVAFHVNYWDNLGWKDRLSSRTFTDRQYALASGWGTRSVYTPCFVRNGAEWHPDGDAPGPSGGDAGMLEVEIDGNLCRAQWSPAGAGLAGGFDVHVAVLGGGIISRVSAGENRGSTLTHEFVALGLADQRLESSGAGPQLAEFPLPALSVSDAPRRAIAAWVTRRGELTPIQATGGWLGVRG